MISYEKRFLVLKLIKFPNQKRRLFKNVKNIEYVTCFQFSMKKTVYFTSSVDLFISIILKQNNRTETLHNLLFSINKNKYNEVTLLVGILAFIWSYVNTMT